MCTFGSRTVVQLPSCRTTIHTEYLPFGTGTPFSVMFLFVSKEVAQLAPGVHTSFHRTTCPKSGSRPRARGREYSMVIFVPSMICDIVPISLARICAAAADGHAASIVAENAHWRSVMCIWVSVTRSSRLIRAQRLDRVRAYGARRRA